MPTPLPKAQPNSIFKHGVGALAGSAQWIERRPANLKVTGLIPSQGTCLGCEPGPHQEGAHERQPVDESVLCASVFLSFSFSLPSLLSKNK